MYVVGLVHLKFHQVSDEQCHVMKLNMDNNGEL